MFAKLLTMVAVVPLMITVAIEAANGQDRIGDATKVVRDVTGALGQDLRRLHLEDDVYHNEVIESAAESASLLTFLDETTLSIGPSSRITLDDIVFNPDPSTSQFVASLVSGIMRFTTGTLPDPVYAFKTPTATIGVRGTAGVITHFGLCTEIVPQRGTITVEDCSGGTGELASSSGKAFLICKQASGICATTVQDPSNNSLQLASIMSALLGEGEPPITVGAGPFGVPSVLSSLLESSEPENRQEVDSTDLIASPTQQ